MKMYAALNQQGILTYAQVAIEKETYYCCNCGQKVKLILTASKNYFRHTNKITNDINERQIHVLGKQIILTELKKLNLPVETEHYLPQICQRPDLLVNQRLAVEYQCAKINIQTLTKRIRGYQQLKLPSIWILGGNYFSQQVKQEHLKFIDYNLNWGFYLIMLNSVQKQLILFHHIKFLGPFNKIFAQKEIFSDDKLGQIFTSHPKRCQLSPQVMDEYLLTNLRRRNDDKSRKVKMEFYLRQQLTVEDYLRERTFPPLPPIYVDNAWQMACGVSKQYLKQPLLDSKRQKRPPAMGVFLLMRLFK